MSQQSETICFLLNYDYRDTNNHFQITLYAVTDNHRPVQIIIDNFCPLFFIPRSTPPDLINKTVSRKPLPLKAMDGTDVDCLYFNTYSSMQECARRLRNAFRIVYESDVHPVERYLMERYVKGGFRVIGTAVKQNNKLVFRSPQIRGCEMTPSLSVLSIDIETNASNGHLYSMAFCGEKNQVFIIGNEPDKQGIKFCKNESELLNLSLNYIRSTDPDILIGWSVVDFDLKMIQLRCETLSVPFDIGRQKGARVVITRNNKTLCRIPGRLVMDIPLMLRAYYKTFEEYSLNFVAYSMLNETKEIELTGREKIEKINYLYKHDKLSLASYNLKDAVLTKRIFEKSGILPNAIERTRRSGQLLDRPGGSINAFDYLYLPQLHRAGYVACDIVDAANTNESLPGGYVLEPTPGIYENVLVLDFRSLYPSIILTFMIDPLGYIVPSNNRIKGPCGPSFSADKSILPKIISELLEARAAAKRDNNPYLSQAIKILMNSFYGVLGAKGCRFFSSVLARTITSTGQFILKKTIEYISNSTPYSVIYGDTDSLFVLLGPSMEKQASVVGNQIANDVTSWLKSWLNEQFGVNSALLLQFENHFRHFLMPSVRGGTNTGSKKHYCGSIIDHNGLKLHFKGMESARSDWTDLAKEVQYELILRVFAGKPIDDYLIKIVNDVKEGRYDNKLVYKKRLRKGIDEYTVNIPPHVQAARLLDNPPHLIRYVITVDGPQPTQKTSSSLDYEHYIESQIKPVADSILELNGKSFDNIISGQQDLFISPP